MSHIKDASLQAHLPEHVKRIVAGRPVCADTKIDPSLLHGQDRGEPIPQLRITGRGRKAWKV